MQFRPVSASTPATSPSPHADIDVLSNILNNSPILNDSLNNLTITVSDNGVLNGIAINVLGGVIYIDA